MRKLTEEFFDNKSEQNKIKSAIHQAIPEGIFYHNLVIVLSEIIKDMVWEMTKEDVFKKAHRPTKRSPDARKPAPKNRSKNKKGSAKPARG